MRTRSLTIRAVFVGVAEVTFVDEPTESAPALEQARDEQQKGRPLLHHYHRRHGFGFVPHRVPVPKKIVRSDL